jgi:HD superfamily phosphodiesterase
MDKVKEKEAKREGKRNKDSKKRSNQRDNEKEEIANLFSGTNQLATPTSLEPQLLLQTNDTSLSPT